MPCTRSWAEGESSWTVVVPGIRWRNCEILLLSEVAFTVSMVVMRRSFAAWHSTHCIRVAARAALMLSLMAIGEVVRGEPSPLIMSLRSRRVRPFLAVGAFGEVWGMAAAGAGFADSVEAFFLPFLATWAHVDGAGVDATRGGGGGGGGGFTAGGSGVDPEACAGDGEEVRSGTNLWKFAIAQSTVLLSFACCLSSAWECCSVM